MKLSFHGQSTIYFESNGKKVIVDPFISGNDKSDLGFYFEVFEILCSKIN